MWSEGRCGPWQVLYWVLRGQNPGTPCSIYKFVDLKHKTLLFEPRRVRLEENLGNYFLCKSPK